MINDYDDVSPAKCRERRRRRIEMRRSTSVSLSASTDTNSVIGVDISETQLVPTSGETPPSDTRNLIAAFASVMPTFGVMSVAGRLREMEDAISIRTDLCRPVINLSQPVHFFGVFDGHGGPHVSALCRDRMHLIMADELTRVNNTGVSESGGSSSRGATEDWWRRVMRRSFLTMDEVAQGTCACGANGVGCTCHPMELALSGSTAVVAILTPETIIVGNCGDSRAVLCRSGKPIPLSFDQKPDRVDELARIEALGGKVVFVDGARVEGMLAMSRAIGDTLLKPYVTAEPEISFTRRAQEDECLIIASDGLWDVMSNELACEVAHECLQERAPSAIMGGPLEVQPDQNTMSGPWPIGPHFESQSESAAALLTRLALGRKSNDNISVILVDLRS